MPYHLAQVNIARARASLADPLMADFVARLEEINRLAEKSAGFIWRSADTSADELRVFDTYGKPFDPERLLHNMSVWESVDALRAYVFATSHAELLRGRTRWFDPLGRAALALWWIPAGTVPTVAESARRLRSVDAKGPSSSAFTFARIFPPPLEVRTASPADVPELVRLVNEAFTVEAFFKIGDRTNADEMLRMMADGEFLMAEDEAGLVGSVYLRVRDDRAYFGMLSIRPARQGGGLGTSLVEAVESRARLRGCREMDIHIVNLRAELPPFYRRLGYSDSGTLPFSDDERSSRPCHFVVMTKPLAPHE